MWSRRRRRHIQCMYTKYKLPNQNCQRFVRLIFSLSMPFIKFMTCNYAADMENGQPFNAIHPFQWNRENRPDQFSGIVLRSALIRNKSIQKSMDLCFRIGPFGHKILVIPPPPLVLNCFLSCTLWLEVEKF